jgi:predicted secreted Zn-dependent protease
MIKIIPCSLLALLVLSPPVVAKVVTQTVSFPVGGTTPSAVIDNIKAAKIPLKPGNALAVTVPATRTDSKTRQSGGLCLYGSFKTSIIFTTLLPRATGKLSSADRKNWQQLIAYLKVHEGQHRKQWQACLADYDAGALRLSASGCAALEKKREALLRGATRKCVGQDEALDYQLHKDLFKQPFFAASLAK